MQAVMCTLPALPEAQFCPAAGTPDGLAFTRKLRDEFGWVYCENAGEGFFDACSDRQDNDGNGAIDCADISCRACRNCTASPDAEICSEKCRYSVILSQQALVQARAGELHIRCTAP